MVLVTFSSGPDTCCITGVACATRD